MNKSGTTTAEKAAVTTTAEDAVTPVRTNHLQSLTISFSAFSAVAVAASSVVVVPPFRWFVVRGS
jgi:hypothetical protein